MLNQAIEIVLTILVWAGGIAVVIFLFFSLVCYPAVKQNKINLIKSEEMLEENAQVIESALYLAHMPELQKQLEEVTAELKAAKEELKKIKAQSIDAEAQAKKTKKGK